MSLKQSMTNTKGFTIVELLIVVIVIAILATITIVSFNNITGRANQSASDAAVATFAKKAELFAADGPTGKYPLNAAALNADSTKSYFMDSGYTYLTGAAYPTSPFGLTSDDKNKVTVYACPANTTVADNVTGLRVYGWNFTGTVGAALKKTIGTCA